MERVIPDSHNQLDELDDSIFDENAIKAELNRGYANVHTNPEDDGRELAEPTRVALHELTELTPGDTLLRTARDIASSIESTDLRDRAYIALGESYGTRGDIASAHDIINLIKQPRRKLQGLASLASTTGFDTFALEAKAMAESDTHKRRVDLLSELHRLLSDNETIVKALAQDRRELIDKERERDPAVTHPNQPTDYYETIRQASTIALISGELEDLEVATAFMLLYIESPLYVNFPDTIAAMIYRAHYDNNGHKAAKEWVHKLAVAARPHVVSGDYTIHKYAFDEDAESNHTPHLGRQISDLVTKARTDGIEVMGPYFEDTEKKLTADNRFENVRNFPREYQSDIQGYIYVAASAQLARDEIESTPNPILEAVNS